MTCDACQAAEQNLVSGLYHSDCDGCKVRMVVNSRQLFDASRSGKITPEYQELLMRMFGDDWKSAHERVKVWNARLKGTK